MPEPPGLPCRDSAAAVPTTWTCLSCGAIGDRQSCSACGAEAMPGSWVPVADLYRVVREGQELRSALRDALWTMDEAAGLLTPGMKAGTGAAKAKLKNGVDAAREALDA